MSARNDVERASEGYVTVVTGGQLFGLRLERVRDVFVPKGLSHVPLAPPEVAGLLNLRGRIVTAIDLRRRLGLPPRADGGTPVAVGIEERGELYGLIVDRIGDVLWLKASSYEANPVNLDERWAKVCAGVHRLDQGLLVVLDVDKVLDLTQIDCRLIGKMEERMKHCLVVDDSAVIRKVAKRILEELRFSSSEAENGRDALDQCRMSMPDAVLLDWNMPVMDGIAFLVALRKEQGGSKPKVIFCTTENDVEHITRAISAGANEYIMKPFDRDIIEAKFHEVGLI